MSASDHRDRQRTIVAFGYHDRASPRHRSVVAALEEDGWTVIECHTERHGILRKTLDLLRQWKQLRRGAQALLVPFPGHYLMPLAWMLTRFPRRRLLFDAFLSLHDTMVDDRKLVSRFSPWAWWLWSLDWLSTHLADDVLLDTEAHRQFFLARFHLPPEKVYVVYLQARSDLFHPAPNVRSSAPARSHCTVFFYGSYIPLQGIDCILRAAAILQPTRPDIRFLLVGRGQTYTAMRALASSLHLTNIEFRETVPLPELPSLIRRADLCLGIFGTTAKAARVIPHKVVDAVACGVPVLTADTPAIRERFANHPLVLLCEAGNPTAIAAAISARVSPQSEVYSRRCHPL